MHVFQFLEIIVRRLDVETLKGSITKQLFSENCKGNELTSYLILTANKAKNGLDDDQIVQSL
jgi:hypothetical protein